MKELSLLKDFAFEEVDPISEDDFWKYESEHGAVIEPLSKPCGDCAITTGFYLEFAEGLQKQSKEIKEKVADRWFCHNACNRGCAGIREFLKQNS